MTPASESSWSSRLKTLPTDAELTIRVRDEGEGFDPASVPDPLAEENLLKTSGRGMLMIRTFMDDVQLGTASGGGTEVRMVKRIPHRSRRRQASTLTFPSSFRPRHGIGFRAAGVVYDAPKMLKAKLLLVAIGLAAVGPLAGSSAQPLPVDYVVRLASATNYDTRSKDEDTVHASITVFVNGVRKETAIWDGKGWDGSRAEGRRWVPGLHVFGPAGTSTVQAATGRIQDTDTVDIVFELLNSSGDPSAANHETVAERIQRTACAGGDDSTPGSVSSPRRPRFSKGGRRRTAMDCSPPTSLSTPRCSCVEKPRPAIRSR